MFGMGDNDDDERYWNLIMFKIYATDKEMEGMAPFMVVAFVVILVIVGILSIL